MVYNYWDKLNGAIGNAKTIKIPLKAKSVKLQLSGNAESVGGKVTLYYIKKNSDATSVTSKLVGFNSAVKPIYNETLDVINNGYVLLTANEQNLYFDVRDVGWVSLGGTAPISNISAKFIFSENEPSNFLKQKITSDYSLPVNITNELSVVSDKPFTNNSLVKLFENEKSFCI